MIYGLDSGHQNECYLNPFIISTSVLYTKMISFVGFPQVMDFPTCKKSQVLSPKMSSAFNPILHRSSTKVPTKELDQF